ncbi:UbiA-like protein EboC [Pleurocapsales cyanobacterium LEGE 10410]|nr:UbiA-like protein EboC [Pleurocapsales cyanobacterium LEGE 10410]
MSTTTVKSQSILAYLQLMRPANILTAWADILLGYAAAGAVTVELNHLNFVALGWLILATTGLYGGGVVFNDVCDAKLDAVERPERPLPSGRASLPGAILLGTGLLVGGIVAAAMVSSLSAVLAAIVATTALLYDKWGKHQTIIGPLNMGVCRGGNLLLGVSAIPEAVGDRWYLALIPIIYIAAITAISQGEVSGGKKSTGIVALALIGIVVSIIVALGLLPEYTLLITLPFLTLFTALVVPPFIKAAINPSPELIQMAVKAGVLSLIVLDATIAVGFANWLYGLLLLALLPLSRFFARLFAVT